MSKKSKVLKAFLILAAAIAICMYFSRTIQTITTPKVKLVTADVGRIEQKISAALTPYFPRQDGDHSDQGQGLSHNGG